MRVAFILSGLPDGLQCLERNRQRVAETLNKYGWITRVETTFYSQASLLATINEYKHQEIEDFIFFYTGHGDASSDEGILTLRLHDGTTIDINTLHREYFSKLNIQRKAIVLDACYSGNFEGRKFHDKTEYLCSSDFDEESYEDSSDGGLQQSYFSYYFCEAIEKLEGAVTLDRINKQYLKPKVDVQNSKYISIDSQMVIADKNYTNILDELEEVIPKESSSINKIFLIFNESNSSNSQYSVMVYIHYEDEYDNKEFEFSFSNIYDKVEQSSFVNKLINEAELDDVSIHFILPPSLFLLNFKQWEYEGNRLVNLYHIILHNQEKFLRSSKRYKPMIKKWDELFEPLKNQNLSNALFPINSEADRFNTRERKIGVCFRQSLSDYNVIKNILIPSNMGLWQYKEGEISDYCRWVDGNIFLKDLNYKSRECDYMALLWDDMRLLEKVKNRR